MFDCLRWLFSKTRGKWCREHETFLFARWCSGICSVCWENYSEARKMVVAEFICMGWLLTTFLKSMNSGEHLTSSRYCVPSRHEEHHLCWFVLKKKWKGRYACTTWTTCICISISIICKELDTFCLIEVLFPPWSKDYVYTNTVNSTQFTLHETTKNTNEVKEPLVPGHMYEKLTLLQEYQQFLWKFKIVRTQLSTRIAHFIK